MKFTIGGYQGQAMPRIVNPFLFLFMALAMLISGLCVVAGGLLILALTPFSFLFRVRQTG